MKKMILKILAMTMIMGCMAGSMLTAYAGGGSVDCLTLLKEDMDKVEWLMAPGTVTFSFEDAKMPFDAPSANAEIAWDDDTGKIYVVSASGEVLVPCGRYDYLHSFVGSYAVVCNRDRLDYYGMIDDTGKEVIAPKYQNIIPMSEGLIGVQQHDENGGQWGFIDINEKWVIGPYSDGYLTSNNEYCGNFNKGIAVVTFGEYPNFRPTVIDKTGNLLMAQVFTWDAVPGIEFTGDDLGSEEIVWYKGGMLVNVTGIGLGVMKIPSITDVPSSWALEQVNSAIRTGLVPETLQRKYTQNATRAEFCALAVQLIETVQGKEITQRKSFADTDDVNVQKIGGLGIVTGVGDDKFAPDNMITREQAALILTRVMSTLGKPLEEKVPSFADNSSISSWALTAVGQVQAGGIMGGTGNNTFSPEASYTREQSIVTILRIYDLAK